MNTELYQKLTDLAFKKSKSFCYQCYCQCPTGVCKTCGSDDLMRLVDGVGCEYGTDWVIKYILETELDAVDLEQAFEQSVRECYPETTKVGWCEFDTVTLLKEQDQFLGVVLCLNTNRKKLMKEILSALMVAQLLLGA